ncbi:RDD family protein [Alistipes sp. ZOR0009]|uniref:RDD family protein n=1 Tax=Alistipes sp. ZOR0009 TaxID=1339253 RepID=UPI00068A48B2|nr:RDD family protein [Alistipes sp. ZOR0009]
MLSIFKITNGKKVAVFAALAILSGLIFELVAYLGFITTQEGFHLYWNLKCISPNLQMGLLNSDIQQYHGNGNAIPVNLFNVLIYITGLVGLVIFYVSKFKEIRLIRFFFSIVFLSNGITLFFMVINAIRWISNPAFNLFLWVLNFVMVIFWCLISFIVLRHYMQERELEMDSEVEDLFGNKGIYESPSKLQRLFHSLVDTCIAVGVCSALVASFYLGVISNDYFATPTSLERSLVILLSMFVLYALFEWLFGATPGKMLTESRTIKTNGGKLTLGCVLGRSFARFIPFESFSFLTYGDGWHDLLSKTTVVKEKRTGIAGRWYWLLPLGYLLLVIGIYVGGEMLEKYRFKQENEKNYSRHYNQLQRQLDKITPNTVIILNSIEGDYSSGHISLIVDKVISDAVEVSIIPNEGVSNLSEMAQRYTQMKPLVGGVRILISDLKKGITPSMSDYISNKIVGFRLPNDNHRYAISDFALLDRPFLSARGKVLYDSQIITFYLETKGSAADLIAAKNIEGDINWAGTLPLQIKSADLNSSYENEITMIANNCRKDENIKSILTLKDSQGCIYQFMLTVQDKECSIEKIN